MTRGLLLLVSSALAALAPVSAVQLRWGAEVLSQKPEWYRGIEARAVADNVIRYQSPQGGWPKNTDLAVSPASSRDVPPPTDGLGNTLDNGATTMPMRFLALMVQATGEAKYRQSFERGMDYLLAAQYPNGGWPQFFPLRDGYFSRITFNDNATTNVLAVLRDAASGKPPYDFVDDTRRARARAAVARGIDVILRTQVKQDVRLTAWCAQHDERTLEPAWARRYEPPSLSGNETVGLVRFLMEMERPTPAMVAAVEGAVAWLRAVEIRGLRLEEFVDAEGQRDRRVVADQAAGPLWARFYELGTNRPIFLGRDSIVRYSFDEIERERRAGYAYYGTWPARLLAEDYPRWRAALVQGRAYDPVPLAASRAAKLTDLEYGQAGGERVLLDVRVPDGAGPFPIAILVHGGGWTSGDKGGVDKPGSSADITPWFAPLTDAKLTWFSINYRLAPKHRWPAPLDDVLTAIRWVKSHAAEYKGDSSRIALIGHSAGGHLASLAAMAVDDSVRVQAVVGYAPVTWFEQEMRARGEIGRAQQALLNRPKDLTAESLALLRAISPLTHVRPGLPPFLLLHGDADRSVPLQQSRDFQERLRASGVRCDLIVLPGASHRLTEWANIMPDHGARMIAWLREVLGDSRRSRTGLRERAKPTHVAGRNLSARSVTDDCHARTKVRACS